MLKGALEMPHLSVLCVGWVWLHVMKAFTSHHIKYFNKIWPLRFVFQFPELEFVKSWDFLISLY